MARRLDAKPSLTAEVNAMQRAAESLLPEDRRLIEDPFARHFVRRAHYRLMFRSPRSARFALPRFDRAFGGLQATIILRARYADDVIRDATAAGVDQVVLLGAGFDSSALRYDGPPATFYEVDSPTTQEAKRAAIEEHGLRAPHPHVFVACDFERDRVSTRLGASGFDPGRPCVAIWLGVSYYLSREAFDQAVGDVAAFSAPASTLVLDYIDPAIPAGTVEDPAARRWMKSVSRRGEPYRFGATPAEMDGHLEAAGFAVREHAGIPDLARRYGNADGVWCSVKDFVSLVRAKRTGPQPA